MTNARTHFARPKRQDKWYWIDRAMMIILPILATWLSFQTEAELLGSVLLFFGLPALFLSIRAPGRIAKSALFSVATAVPAIIVIDTVAHRSSQWLSSESAFPVLIFGAVTIEALLWAFLQFYLVVITYEHFMNHGPVAPIWSGRLRRLALILGAVVAATALLVVAKPSLLVVPYFYLVFGTVCIALPIAYEWYDQARFIAKFVKIALYFFLVTIAYEVSAVKLGWWSYPGEQFIGHVTLLGARFPLEELVFWTMLLAMAIVALYERIDDSARVRIDA